MPRLLSIFVVGAAFACTLAATPVHAQIDRVDDRSDPSFAQAIEADGARAALRAHRVSRRVASSLDRARVDRNRIQMRCLDRTLTEVNAVLRMVRRGRRRLASVDEEELRHRRTVFVVLDRRLTDLQAQAITCEGRDPAESASGETRVEVFISPDVPRVDPTEPRPLPVRGHIWDR